MKQSIIMLAGSLLLAGISNAQTRQYKITADIKNQGDYKLSTSVVLGMEKTDPKNVVRDGDHFEMTGDLTGKEPVLVMISSANPSAKYEYSKGGMFMPGPALDFFMTDKPVTITGDVAALYKAKVTGDKVNDEYNKLKEKTLPLIEKGWELKKKAAAMKAPADSTERKALQAEGKVITAEITEIQKKFVAANPKSYISVVLLQRMYEDYEIAGYEKAYNKLSADMKQTAMGQNIAAKIKGTKETAIGSKAPDFSKPDLNGNPIALNSLKGKYVLVDFWGSWCGPCRAGNPHLKELYAKYQSKGFEIISVSAEKADKLEDAIAAWKKAVAQDGMTWLNVLNNYDKAKDDLVPKFAVTGFPTKFLLDKTGKIIYKEVGTGGTGLDDAMKKIFGE